METEKAMFRGQSGLIVLSLALVISASILAVSFFSARNEKSSVVVKGLSEREVNADLSVWEINFSSGGNDPSVIQAKIEKDRKAVTAFLENEGFISDEIVSGRLIMNDKFAYGYYPEEGKKFERYSLKTSVILRSSDVALVDRVSRMTGELVRLGVVLSDNYSGPSFLFTGINSIKNEMLEEAVKNARKAAETFAANTGASVKGIRNANQGVFSILPGDMTETAREEQQIRKKVRVVSTIEYYLGS